MLSFDKRIRDIAMHFIEHIIEPSKLLLCWRSPDENIRTRYIVAELNRVGDEITLSYLCNTKDFINAQNEGFTGYPAFQDIKITHHNVLDAFMRRLPPRTRGDFKKYLEGLRLKPDAQLSDFALLGYSGARLPTDSFSIVHPFNQVAEPCELLLEATGYRRLNKSLNLGINIGDTATFAKEYNEQCQEEAIRIVVGEKLVGYITRALVPTFQEWLEHGRIVGAWIEKTNGTPTEPTAYLFVSISSK